MSFTCVSAATIQLYHNCIEEIMECRFTFCLERNPLVSVLSGKVPKGNLTDGLFPTVAKKEGEEKDLLTRSLCLLEEQFGCKVVFLLLFAQHQH